MNRNKIFFRLFAALVFAALAVLTVDSALAQNYGGGNSGGNSGGSNRSGNSGNNSGGSNRSGNSGGNNNNNSGSGGGGGATPMSGVLIQADGLLQRAVESAALDQTRLDAAYRGIPSEMNKPSASRKVSLNRLEKAILANDGIVSEEMARLAGLTRIENVFYYPETQDIVIAGPAEGWEPGIEGSTVGIQSGRPTLNLTDLVVALRAYPAGGQPTERIGCSIDPTAEGLVAMRDFLRSAVQPNIADANELNGYADGIRNALGYQTVKVWGVSPKTRFAAAIVAADYRMKLIGIGLEPAPVKMTTYIEKSTPQSISQNALVRWFFEPNYDCVVQAKDSPAIALIGDGVRLVGEDELVTESGQRRSGGSTNRATKLYAKSFTDKFAQIAAKLPVYAELRNLIDMSVVAAWIQREGLCEKADWSMEFFASEDRFPVETGNAVQMAETAVNIVAHGKSTVSFPTGGGVLIEPVTALNAEHLQKDKNDTVQKKYNAVGQAIPENVWWWD